MFFCSASFANANIIINEVQLNPTEDRFIEIYNSSSSSVDLTDWYIQRKTATGSSFGSLISKTYFEGKNIEANDYFLISKNEMTNADIVYDSLTLTDSNTIQIKNPNQEVVDKVGWGDVSDCGEVCAPNPVDGKSIGRISDGSWVIASSTPRAQNIEPDGGEEEENPNDETNTNTTSTKDEPLILKITTKIISPKMVTAGIPFSLSSLTTTNRGETYAVGRYVWNLGDGMISESNKSDSFTYLYEYPGEYILTLSYFDSFLSKEPDSTNRVTIKVVSSEVYISSVGNEADPFIEIENKSNYEVLLSSWRLVGGIHYFIIPDGTTILPNKKIKFSPKITGFTAEDIKYVVIKNLSQEIVATYPLETKKSIKKKISSISTDASNNLLPLNNLPDNSSLKDSQVVNLNDLGANVSESGINIPNVIYRA